MVEVNRLLHGISLPCYILNITLVSIVVDSAGPGSASFAGIACDGKDRWGGPLRFVNLVSICHQSTTRLLGWPY
jgi:hypothetical protein